MFLPWPCFIYHTEWTKNNNKFLRMKSNSNTGVLMKSEITAIRLVLLHNCFGTNWRELHTNMFFFHYYYLLARRHATTKHIQDDIDNYWLIKSSCIHIIIVVVVVIGMQKSLKIIFYITRKKRIKLRMNFLSLLS